MRRTIPGLTCIWLKYNIIRLWCKRRPVSGAALKKCHLLPARAGILKPKYNINQQGKIMLALLVFLWKTAPEKPLVCFMG